MCVSPYCSKIPKNTIYHGSRESHWRLLLKLVPTGCAHQAHCVGVRHTYCITSYMICGCKPCNVACIYKI